jgi:hypothetical protein
MGSTEHIPPNTCCFRIVRNDWSCECTPCKVSVFDAGIMLPCFSEVRVPASMPCWLQLCYRGQQASCLIITVERYENLRGSCCTSKGTKWVSLRLAPRKGMFWLHCCKGSKSLGMWLLCHWVSGPCILTDCVSFILRDNHFI